MAGRRNEGLADAAPLGRADGDVLQVRVGGRQPARGRHGLVVAGVDAPGGRVDLLGQLVGVGRLQLGQPAVVQDQARQFVLGGQFLEHVFCGRRLALGRLAQHRDLELLEQDLLQLFGRVEVELAAGGLVRQGRQVQQLARQLAALRAQQPRVDQHAAVFHGLQHGHQRLLEFFVQRAQRRFGLKARPQRLVQAQRHVGIFGRVLRGGVDGHLVKGDLLGALARDRLVLDRFDAQVALRDRVHVVTRGHAVQHIGLEHGVVALAGQGNAVVAQHMRVVLQVMADLVMVRAFQQGLELGQRRLAVQLVGCAGVMVRQRQVGRLAHLGTERHAHDARLGVIQAGGLGVQRKQRRSAQQRDPAVQLFGRGDRLVIPRQGAQCGVGIGVRGQRVCAGHCAAIGSHGGGGCGGAGIAAIECAQPALELHACIQGAQRVGVLRARLEVQRVIRQFDIQANGGQLARQGQRLEARAQVLADLAADLGGVGHDGIQRVVLGEPFCRGLGAHFVDARDVVGAVADQREVIHDLLGPHLKLGFHAIAVEARIGHGVDERDVAIHQLRHVLVTGGDHHLLAGLGGAARQRADDVVGLDAFDAQQRQAQRLDRIEQWLDLRAQVIGHRRAVRLVGGKEVVAEGAAGGIEHHHHAAAGLLAREPLQHVQHAIDRARGLAARVGQRRQRMEGAIQVGRAVDQDQRCGVAQWMRFRGSLLRSGSAGVVAVAGVAAGVTVTGSLPRSGRYRAPLWPQAASRAEAVNSRVSRIMPA